VKNLKISNFAGENDLKVVSLIRGAIKRLTNLKDARGQSALPTVLANHLLDVFQTALCSEEQTAFRFKTFSLSLYCSLCLIVERRLKEYYNL
jgi:hypothetical protein